MASPFQQTKQNISLHVNNCFKECELEPDSVVKESLTTAADGKKYRTKYYNLDVIISVGYRVKSRRSTQFRQWATKRLHDYLVEGYAINQKRLEEKNLELRQLKDGISILRRAITSEAKSLADASGLASLLDRFASGLELRDDYDHLGFDGGGKTKRSAVRIEAAEYRDLVASMVESYASSIFGMEKVSSFDSAVGQIYQSFSSMATSA